MAPKITVFFIIAISLYTVRGEPNPLVLDIGKFNLTKRGDGADPRKHKALEFVPHGRNKITSVIYGPSSIWGDSSGYFLRAMELHTFCGFPQLIKLELSDESTTKVVFYKSQDASFTAIPENEFLSYKTILNLDEYPIDYNVMFDVGKEPSPLAFYRENSRYQGFDSVDFTPKADFKVRGITAGRSSIFFSDHVITKIIVVRLEGITRCVKIYLQATAVPKVFVFISQWMLCQENAVKEVLDNVLAKTQKGFQTQAQETVPTTPSTTDIVPPSSETQILLPEVFSPTKMVAMNLIKQPPPSPISVVKDTNPDPKDIVVNLNDIGSDFSVEPLNYGDFDVTRAVPKEGCRIIQIVECGYIVWQNDRGAETIQLVLYKKLGLPLLLVLSTERSGSKTEYFVRKYGKLVDVEEPEFNGLLELWKVGDQYDKTVAFSLVDSNNFEVFDVVNKLVDGVHYFSVSPKAGFQLVRIANGSNELVLETGEQWTSLTIMFFDSTHRLLSLNVVNNGKQTVRMFDCKACFSELDKTTYNNIYIENKSRVHHMSDLLLDLNNPKNAVFVSPVDENINLLMPLSGYHVKIVTLGKTFLWRSTAHRCTSVMTLSDDVIQLAKLDIMADNSTSDLYYRFIGQNALKLKGIEEFNFIKSKVMHNYKNKHLKDIVAKPVSYDTVGQVVFFDYDISKLDDRVMFTTDFSDALVVSTFVCKEGHSFRKVTYLSKVLWDAFDNCLCGKFYIYYVGAEPTFGLFEANKNGSDVKECYDYSPGVPTKLTYQKFREHRKTAAHEIDKEMIEPSVNLLSLNVVSLDAFNTSTERVEGMVAITYAHKDSHPFSLILFGSEILWAPEIMRAISVRIVYFDRLPMLMSLKLQGHGNPIIHLSHIGAYWHELQPLPFHNWLKRLAPFETEKHAFTIPELNERTEFDDGIASNEHIMVRRFVARSGLMSNIFDGRNMIFTNSKAHVENVMVWYHGYIPKLFMFRQRDLFGYSFDHYFVFVNGWRELSFAKFEQYFNFFRGKPPLEACRVNQFVFDVTRPDARATVSPVPPPHPGFKYQVSDSNTSFCCVKVDSSVMWIVPKSKEVRTFYTFGPRDAPTLALFEEELWESRTDVFVQFDGKSWKEIDKKTFSDALNSLTSSTAASLSPMGTPPTSPSTEYVVLQAPPSMPPIPPMPPMSPTPPMPPMSPMPPTEPTKPMQPMSPMPTEPQPTPTPPLPQSVGFPITKPSGSGAQVSPLKLAKVRRQPSSQVVLVELDLSGSVDSATFKTASGLCDSFVPFNEYKTRAGFELRTIRVSGALAWHSETDSCLSIKAFLHEGRPIILELLVSDSAGKKRFMFMTLGETGWAFVDESAFDTALDTLVAFYKANPNG